MKQRVVTRRARKEKKLKEQRQEEERQHATVAVVQGTSDTTKSTTQADDAQDKAPNASGPLIKAKPLNSSSIGSQGALADQVKSSDSNASQELLAVLPESSRPIAIGTSAPSSAHAHLSRTGTSGPNDDYVDEAGGYDWLEDHGIEGPSALNGASYPSSSLTSMVTGSLSWFLRSSPSTAQTTGSSVPQQTRSVPQATMVQPVHAVEDEWEPASKSVLLDKDTRQGTHHDELDFAEIVYGA